MKKQSPKKGFTIIEVVLVLAIAGLIFLMVFVALPALQRSQRDTQRRDDMARFMSQLTQYQSNNNGNVPDTQDKWSNFVTNYLRVGGDAFEDPQTGEPYAAKKMDCASGNCSAPNSETISANPNTNFIYNNATCDGENPSYDSGKRKVAILYKLEGSGTYCGHN